MNGTIGESRERGLLLYLVILACKKDYPDVMRHYGSYIAKPVVAQAV